VFSSGLAERGDELRQAFCRWGLAVSVAFGLLGGAGVQAATTTGPETASVSMASLPEPAQQTYRRVLSAGPFADAKDGTVFGNRERLLPGKGRGYYREYTVQTPGSADRGARRIVCGGERPAEPEACYYTADHYASFRRIVQ
jgi:ribonuclease T1